MAFLVNNDEEDKKQDQTETGPVLGAPGAAPIQGQPGSAQETKPSQPTKSGQFTNLMSYINANAGNDAAMAGAVRGQAQGAADKANNANTVMQTGATDSIQSGTVQDHGLVNQVRNMGTQQVTAPKLTPVVPHPAPAAVAKARTSFDQAMGIGGKSYTPHPPARQAAPAAGIPLAGNTPARSPAHVNQDEFNRQYNAKYTGINAASDAAGYDDAHRAANKVDQYGRLAGGDISDRGQLLTDVYGDGGNQYNAGERRLDSFILGAGQQGRQAMDQIAKDYTGYGDKFAGISKLLDGQIAGAKQTTQRTQDDTRAAVTTAGDNFRTHFGDASAAATAANTDADRIYTAASKGDIDTLKGLGANADTASWLKDQGVDLSKVARAGGGYTMGDVADRGAVSQYQNLLKLLDGAGSPTTSQFDFAKGNGHSAGLDLGALTKANTLKSFIGGLDSRVKGANDKRFGDSAALTSRNVDTIARDFGLSPDEAAEAVSLGIDPMQYASRNRDLGIGDVTSDQERAQYAGILKALGLDNKYNLADTGDEGAGYTYDRNGLLNALNLLRGQRATTAQQAADTQEVSSKTGQAADKIGDTIAPNAGKESPIDGSPGGFVEGMGQTVTDMGERAPGAIDDMIHENPAQSGVDKYIGINPVNPLDPTGNPVTDPIKTAVGGLFGRKKKK